MIEFVVGRIPVVAVHVGSYDPGVEPDEITLKSSLILMETIVPNHLLSRTYSSALVLQTVTKVTAADQRQ